MRILKVQGKGHVNIAPDMVTLSFDVEAKAKEYAESLRELNTRTEDLRGSMTASGLERAELKTSSFNVRVDSQYKNGLNIFVGYVASHTMRIELPLEKELLNKVLRCVAHGHSGAQVNLAFSVRDKASLRRQV